MDRQRPPNLLAGERSPYLLQHARNPVAWEPWGDAAFDRARREDKPVFLSVGYSACHWCHVMERESFDDEATAAYLNAHFVSVKVDREERPDVDHAYQLAHQLVAQRGGGWPLSMFLDADRRPFYGGTYFPPAPRHGMPSFREILAAIVEAWTQRREDVRTQAAELAGTLARVATRVPAPGEPSTELLAAAVARVLPRIDRAHGGFGAAPKFPNTMTHDLLLVAAVVERGARAKDAGDAVLLTLRRMRAGGIWDHLGGGFARYSTDAEWKVPHFEKMLYDNAQLLRLALHASRLLQHRGAPGSDVAAMLGVAADTAAYLDREMRDADGLYYSAQDADSEGEEGRFFVWTPEQVVAAAGGADAEAVCAMFDVRREGNFEHGRSVLWTPRSVETVAAALGRDVEAVTAAVERARPKMLAARESRPHPMRDEKCLAAWNGLALGAAADLAATVGDDAAVASARGALLRWRDVGFATGRLAHAVKDGEAYGRAFLDDLGGLAGAALDVFEATFDGAALGFARALLDEVLAHFVDAASGGLFFAADDAEVVLHRAMDPSDHAYPGGVGLATMALLRAADLTGEARYRTAAERCLAASVTSAKDHPLGMGSVLLAADRAARGPMTVVVVGDASRDDVRAMLRSARTWLLPHRTLVCATDEAHAAALGVDPSWMQGRSGGAGGAPVAYVCRGTVCQRPAADLDGLATVLRAALAPV